MICIKTKTLTKIALFIALFFICSNIVPPINIIGVSFTCQTIIVLLIPFMFNIKEIIFWYFTLIFICIIGFPIMSGFSGGVGVLIGPSAGFIYSWIIIMFVQRAAIVYNNNGLFIGVVMFLTSIIAIVIGAIYFSFITQTNIYINIRAFLVSFTFIELIKIIIVLLIVKKLPAKYLS